MLLFLVAACGNSADPAAADITTPVMGVDGDGVSFITTANCLACHQEETPDPVAAYLASRHARPGTVDAAAGPECLVCHDPLGDGQFLEHLQPWSDEPGIIPVAGMTVIGCEVCHGAGPHHLAMFPDHPNPSPDYQLCGQCHGPLPEGISAHFQSDFGNNILAKYLASSHGTSLLHQVEQPLCQRCHSDEGFRRHGAETAGLDGLALPGALQGAESFTGATPVQCRTCHDGHSGELRAEATPGYSRSFNLCTSCHQVFLREDQTLDTSRPPYHGELDDEGYPVRADWVIWDTHFATADGFSVGYEIEPASERACTRCHDPHSGGAR